MNNYNFFLLISLIKYILGKGKLNESEKPSSESISLFTNSYLILKFSSYPTKPSIIKLKVVLSLCIFIFEEWFVREL